MNFKPLEIADYPILKPYFADSTCNLSIYSPASLIAWSGCVSQTSYAVEDGTLLIADEPLKRPEDRHLILPVGRSHFPVPAELIDIAKRCGYGSYWFVPEDYLALYGETALSADFLLEEQKEFEDYIYWTEALAELRGNRYTKKRNLLNQFAREYLDRDRVRVENMGGDSREECLDFLEKWCAERDCDPASNWDLACEKKAAVTVIRHLRDLEAEGLFIRIDGQISAFGISLRLNERMGILIFEKAFSRIKGLYQFLDRECAKRLFGGYLYINKESDMNIPELAHSKMSYHPALRVKSYRLTLREFSS